MKLIILYKNTIQVCNTAITEKTRTGVQSPSLIQYVIMHPPQNLQLPHVHNTHILNPWLILLDIQM